MQSKNLDNYPSVPIVMEQLDPTLHEFSRKLNSVNYPFPQREWVPEPFLKARPSISQLHLRVSDFIGTGQSG